MPVQSTFLRRVIAFDAITCAAAGALLTFAAEPLAAMTGLGVELTRPAGIFLLAWTAILAFAASRPALPRAAVWGIVGMNLVSVRLITDDVDRLVGFYARLSGVEPERPTPDFAELRTPNGTLAVGSTRTVALFGPGSAEPAANRSAIVELLVDDVDAVHHAVEDWVEVVQAPTTMPWGNRSLLLRDPDGTLVNVFAPATEAAREKFARFSR